MAAVQSHRMLRTMASERLTSARGQRFLCSFDIVVLIWKVSEEGNCSRMYYLFTWPFMLYMIVCVCAKEREEGGLKEIRHRNVYKHKKIPRLLSSFRYTEANMKILQN